MQGRLHAGMFPLALAGGIVLVALATLYYTRMRPAKAVALRVGDAALPEAGAGDQ
jgi:hypothetical protein